MDTNADVIAVLYKGFMLVGHQPAGERGGHVRAYRNLVYFDDNIASYESTHFHPVYDMIEEVNDVGEFTEEQFEELGKQGRVVKAQYSFLQEFLGALPFIPEPGPPLPEYVSREVYGLEYMAAPVSAYGRALLSEVLMKLKEFLGASFVVTNGFDETGWASDSVMYSGFLKHVPTSTEWWTEISIGFEWRKPENIETMYIDFIARRLPNGEWENQPEEAFQSERWSFDLNASGGISASKCVEEFPVRGWL